MHYKKYSDSEEYDLLDSIAKNNKLGLWSQNIVIEPWNYRNKKSKSEKVGSN